MTLWRLSPHAALDGAGGLVTEARWHTQGHRVIYCASSPASALLEVLVHIEIEPDDLLRPVQYLEIEAPAAISLETADMDHIANWRVNESATRALGDDWLDTGRSALLRVPSVIVPVTWNVLINPLHPDSAAIRVLRIHKQAIDPRLAP